MSKYRVLICGGRDYGGYSTITDALEQVVLDYCREHGAWSPGDVTIVHGDARGADRNGAACAELMGLEVEAHPADWKAHGKGAGPIRNQQMLDTGIDLVLAFPGGRGTADMVRRARKAGVEVREIAK